MAKVFARENAFIGVGNHREVKVVVGELFDDDDPIVVGHSSLFAPVSESTDAEMKNLKAELAELKELIAAQGKAPAKKATAAELKAEPK